MQRRIGSLISTRAVTAYCATTTASRYTVNKKAAEKLKKNDDDGHWLEAEIDENINTPEERYAHERELKILQKMVSDLQKDHTEKLDEIKAERDKEVDTLKKQMSDLEARLKKIQGQ